MCLKKSLRVVVVLFVLSMCSCGMSQSTPNSPPPSASISPQAGAVAPGQTISFTATIGGNSSGLTWFVNGVQGGNVTVGTVDSVGIYTAPFTTNGAAVSVSAQSGNTSATASVAIIPSGQVTATNNPQVALYTVSPPLGASVSIQFGTSTSYGLTTWTQMASGNDTPLSMYVAGMRMSTQYHMRAVLNLSNGAQFTDTDHVFTTGSITTVLSNEITVSTPTTGLTPQSGIELVDALGNGLQAFVTDLSGNIIWTYTYTGGTDADFVYALKPLPNGHFIIGIGSDPTDVLTGPPPAGTINVIREVDLAGNTIHEISLATLNSELAAAGFNLVADTMHHDVTPLPNGHLLIIVNSTQQFTNLPGYPGTTTVLGDQIIDLDTNWNPDWVWNEFDYLDVNRHPMNFPDWTHTNAIIYSQDDGNIIISVRNQNWLLKINFDNGQGDGSIIWHLGNGGDFTLAGGVDPTDWFWAQHGPTFASTNTTGIFSLAVFDDGNDRQFPPGTTCQNSGQPICPYSTAEVFQLNESAMTATITFQDFPDLYSDWGGNAEVLANGNLEYDVTAGFLPSGGTVVLELPQQENPRQIAWQMTIAVDNAYRAHRIPSLYPGVQW